MAFTHKHCQYSFPNSIIPSLCDWLSMCVHVAVCVSAWAYFWLRTHICMSMWVHQKHIYITSIKGQKLLQLRTVALIFCQTCAPPATEYCSHISEIVLQLFHMHIMSSSIQIMAILLATKLSFQNFHDHSLSAFITYCNSFCFSEVVASVSSLTMRDFLICHGR